ncbi:hypothetical protein PoB_006481000 [Plakobranchus ocellatus]|uniref:Uncharacterized protein n=1 Tax=Plakobranchus ocellatus TaxID=259542 RepID=A0AAV4D2H6_9GAST|nr:hypothetical protein PoB_006481000 [Plakobranchus ocellatus]
MKRLILNTDDGDVVLMIMIMITIILILIRNINSYEGDGGGGGGDDDDDDDDDDDENRVKLSAFVENPILRSNFTAIYTPDDILMVLALMLTTGTDGLTKNSCKVLFQIQRGRSNWIQTYNLAITRPNVAPNCYTTEATSIVANRHK